ALSRRHRRPAIDPRSVRGRRSSGSSCASAVHGKPLQPTPPSLSVIFHSLDFVAFFVAVVALSWRLPQRGQNVLLLVASYVFYGYVHPWFLILIASSTTIDY